MWQRRTLTTWTRYQIAYLSSCAATRCFRKPKHLHCGDPRGLTGILQRLECDFIFVYRHHYKKMADEWACKNSNTKLTAT